MRIKQLFSNMIIVSSFLTLSALLADTQITPTTTEVVGNKDEEISLTIAEDILDDQVFLRAVLTDQCGVTQFGNINFHYNKVTNTARIESLHIRPEYRKKSFGSILLTFALQTLTECKCKVVTWLASPFNLRKGEDQKTMLPKLTAFYKKHGAIITDEREFNADVVFYPKISDTNQSSIS